MYAPFEPSTDNNHYFDGKPKSSTITKQYRNYSSNDDFIGHIYSFASTIPRDYLYWFSPSPKKNLTVTGESKAQVLKLFRNSLLQSQLSIAGKLAVELHCSGYFNQAFNIIIEIIGSHIHIHNPNISSHIYEKYKKFRKQMGIPKKCGTIKFPTDDDKNFYGQECVLSYRSTLNCQTVRNFIMELISLICLSHQKEMSLPRVIPSDVNDDMLCKTAKSLKIADKKIKKLIKKNEMGMVLQVIEKYLFFKVPKVEDAIYWILWLIKLESKQKRRGVKMPCKSLSITGVPKTESDHWIWYVWKILIKRLKFYPTFKKIQISNIYYLFKVNFIKTFAICRLPLLFFAIRLLTYDVSNNFPSVINQLHLYVQACSNVNVLYRNLQISLSKRSWVDIVGYKEEIKDEPDVTLDKKRKPKTTSAKVTKKEAKKFELFNIKKKTAYLDILPKSYDTLE
jgi:hypothetical protein